MQKCYFTEPWRYCLSIKTQIPGPWNWGPCKMQLGQTNTFHTNFSRSSKHETVLLYKISTKGECIWRYVSPKQVSGLWLSNHSLYNGRWNNLSMHWTPSFDLYLYVNMWLEPLAYQNCSNGVFKVAEIIPTWPRYSQDIDQIYQKTFTNCFKFHGRD